MRTEYENLANAIIAQAMTDYKAAMRKISSRKEEDITYGKASLSEIRNFMKSAWYRELSASNPEKIMIAVETDFWTKVFEPDKKKKRTRKITC